MKRLIFFLTTILCAQTKVPTAQLGVIPPPTTVGILSVLANGKLQTVTLGNGLIIVQVPGALFPEIRAIVPTPLVTTYVNLKMKQLSDQTWTPINTLIGRVNPATIMVFRNGVLQDDSDFSYDSSNNSIKLVIPLDPTDKLSFSCQTIN